MLDQLRQQVEGKADKGHFVLKAELDALKMDHNKMIGDNSRRVTELENKLRTVENEIQELYQSFKILQRKFENMPVGNNEPVQGKNYDQVID